MIDLAAVHSDLRGDFPAERLQRLYRDALRRGEPDLPAGDPGTRPIGLLVTAIPRVSSATVAAYAIEVLPRGEPSRRGDELDEQMLDVVDSASAGALLRCHLAMDAELSASADELPPGDEQPDAWLGLVFESVPGLLGELAGDGDGLELHALAQDAIRWLANAIDLLDRRDPQRIEAITEVLARLLPLAMFVHFARRRSGG